MKDLDPNPFELLSRPALCLEFLENGTVGEIIESFAIFETVMPNRMLWRFFACRKHTILEDKLYR